MSIIIVVPPQTEATDPVKKSSLLSILFVPSRKSNLTPESTLPGISIWAFESIISAFEYFSLSSFSSIPVSLITFDDIFQFFPI